VGGVPPADPYAPVAGGGRHTERSTLAACVAQVVAVPAVDVPLDDAELRAWLAERGLGLVAVADPSCFAWAGSWIARRPERAGGEPRAVVMFGVPSGPIWDPAGTTDEVLDGFVVAPLELAAWPPVAAEAIATGTVEALVLAPAATAPVRRVDVAVAHPGRGIEGDRYFDGAGTFASGRPGSALTLVDAGVLDELAAARGGSPVDHRRNVVVRGTDLNALVGREFTLGAVRCRGRRLCEPCAHLDRLNDGGLLRPMVHRGGLRADILEAGEIRVGDRLVPVR
jgi:MOSC domain-containing protein YiiM